MTTEIKEYFEEVRESNYLYLDGAPEGLSLKDLDVFLSSFNTLTQVSFQESDFTTLPKSIFQHTNINTFILYDSQIKTLPYEFKNLKKLDRLTLSNSKLQEFPKTILELNDLTQLEIEYCPFPKQNFSFKIFPIKDISFDETLQHIYSYFNNKYAQYSTLKDWGVFIARNGIEIIVNYNEMSDILSIYTSGKISDKIKYDLYKEIINHIIELNLFFIEKYNSKTNKLESTNIIRDAQIIVKSNNSNYHHIDIDQLIILKKD